MTVRHVFTVCALLVAASLAHAVDPLPSPDDLQAMYDKKDWNPLLLASTRVLQLKGAAAQPYDRVDLWMKKAEAQLHLNQFQPASKSMASAAAEKGAAADKVDLALADAELFHRSDAKGYRSSIKAGDPKLYPILDPADRPAALSALFDGEYADISQRTKQVKTATDAKPLVALALDIAGLRPVDRVVNKSTDKTDDLEKTIAGNFVDQAKKWAAAADKNLTDIRTRADERIEQRATDNKGNMTITTRRRGMTSQEKGEVQKDVQQAENIGGNYNTIKKAMSDTGQSALSAAEPPVTAAYQKAKALLADDQRISN